MPGLRPISTSVRFGRRMSRSLETIGVAGEAGEAEVEKGFLLRGIDLRRGVELSASGAHP